MFQVQFISSVPSEESLHWHFVQELISYFRSEDLSTPFIKMSESLVVHISGIPSLCEP